MDKMVCKLDECDLIAHGVRFFVEQENGVKFGVALVDKIILGKCKHC